MNSLWQFLVVHQTTAALVAYYIFGALVGGMPAPTGQSGTAYRWAFGTLNILASNISRARSTTLESSPNWQAALQKAQGPGVVNPPQP